MHSDRQRRSTENTWLLNMETYLWQAEGNGPRVNTGMRLQGEHVLVG